MSGRNDATLKLVYPTDGGTFFAIDTIKENTAFEVVANVEIGSNIMQSVDGHDVWVTVHNLSTGQLTRGEFHEDLADSDKPHLQEVRVPFPAGVPGNDGDVLEAIGSYRVRAGINTDVSTETSEQFMIDNNPFGN